MKNLLLLLFIAVTIVSCNKNDDNPIIGSKAICTINNEAKTFTIVNSYFDGIITMGNDTTEIVGFSLLPTPLPTTLPVTFNSISDTEIMAVYSVNGKSYGATNMGGGLSFGSYELTITENKDSKISGTFRMTVINTENTADSAVISNGVFTDIPYLK
jgi:hypothetical protein